MNKRILIFLLTAVIVCLSACHDVDDKQVQTGTTDNSKEQSIISEPDEVSESEKSSGKAEYTGDGETETTAVITDSSSYYDISICFSGDISLADGAVTTRKMDSSENGIFDCISSELVKVMKSADIMCVNNEFQYSTGGTPIEGKKYHFKADPGRVTVLSELGVDVVNLANNHVFDYGADALIETLDTLNGAGIPYVGAGHNLEEAMEPVYFEVQGKTIAIVAASRAEKNQKTPQATEEEPGILRCYDTELFVNEIQEADEKADFVLAYVHWGTEYSDKLEDVQRETAREYVEAGADVIIGAHPHVLQGMEYIDGVPVIYSLGNYWFNERTLDTMLVTCRFYGDDNEADLEIIITPALQESCKTSYVSDPEKQEKLYSYLEKISYGIDIDEEGILHESH